MNDEIRPAQKTAAASSDDRKPWETPTAEVISARAAEVTFNPGSDATSTS